MPDEAPLGQYLRRLRLQAGYDTADDAARESGRRISAHTIRAIERGHVDRPKPETLEVLSDLYHVPLAELARHAGYASAMLPAGIEGATLSEEERVLLGMYQDLDQTGRDITQATVRILYQRRRREDQGDQGEQPDNPEGTA
jgi:transcriptional regulator with XRE-family HTH domain